MFASCWKTLSCLPFFCQCVVVLDVARGKVHAGEAPIMAACMEFDSTAAAIDFWDDEDYAKASPLIIR